MLMILLVMTVLLVDLGIKSAMEEAEPQEFPKKLDKSRGFIILHRNHNNGFPMGVLRDKPELVRMVPLMVVSAVAGVFLWLFPRKGQGGHKVGISLILGGGLSNLYDRLKRGYVVDYFSVNVKGLKKVVFNLGDIFIFLGTGILLVAELIEAKREH